MGTQVRLYAKNYSLGKAYATFFGSRGANVVVNDLGGSFKGEGKSSKVGSFIPITAEMTAVKVPCTGRRCSCGRDTSYWRQSCGELRQRREWGKDYRDCNSRIREDRYPAE